jgi:hypothetical protein
VIDRFITFKEPVVIEDCFENGTLARKGGMIFRSHVVMTDGRHFTISDAQHGHGMFAINETLVFPCDEDGNVTEWIEQWGGRELRTEEVVNQMNES